jgi:hypothetical protein
MLRDTKFVLSPPGNGPDCHRTWEAIYSGAIPIVKRDFWPFKTLSLPVLVVNDWNEVPEKITKFENPSLVSPETLAKVFLGGTFTRIER